PRATRTRPTRDARQRRHARNAIRRRANFRTTNQRPDQRMSDQRDPSQSNARDESLRAHRTTHGGAQSAMDDGAHLTTRDSERRSTLDLVLENISDEPSRGLSAWLRTTAGVV